MEQEFGVMEPVVRLSKDMKAAAKTLSQTEARYLVDYYYQMQEDRKRSDNQERGLTESNEPCAVLGWLADNSRILEGNIKRALDAYSDRDVTGRWAKSIVGIGPVIAAGLSAHIDIAKAPTVGHIWRFAGLDPTSVWSKGEKRPWNANLKVLCWKIGESFVKVSNHEDDVYGKLLVQRKVYEQQNNLSGALAGQAMAKLEKFNIGKTTDAYLWYSGRLSAASAAQVYAAPPENRTALAKSLVGDPVDGLPMLPPAHLHARAKRWAVKLFLAHWWTVAYFERFGTMPPKPYVLSQLQHGHEITVPAWPF